MTVVMTIAKTVFELEKKYSQQLGKHGKAKEKPQIYAIFPLLCYQLWNRYCPLIFHSVVLDFSI